MIDLSKLPVCSGCGELPRLVGKNAWNSGVCCPSFLRCSFHSEAVWPSAWAEIHAPKPKTLKPWPWYIRLLHWLQGRKYYVSVDYASEGGDYTSFISAYRDRDGFVHIVDTFYEDADGNEVQP